MSEVRLMLGRVVFLGAAIATVGCGHFARPVDEYRTDTRSALQKAVRPITACYAAALAANPSAAGTVTARFAVEHDTGRIAGAHIVPGKTTAPDVVGACVLAGLEGLTLDPPDALDGDATFTWVFERARTSRPTR